MKKMMYTFFLSLLILPLGGYTQIFEWVNSIPSLYSLNPVMLSSPLTDTQSGHLISARLDSFATYYGQHAYGKFILEKRDSSGLLEWNFSMSNKCVVQRLASDQTGNIYACGRFMDTLDLNGTDQLIETSPVIGYNIFLIKLDPGGSLVWKRNISESHSQTSVEDLQTDPSGNLWYTLNDFGTSALYKTTASGDDADSLLLQGTLILSSFSFDPWGAIYIAGSTEAGTMTFGNQNFTVPHSYNMFIGRYDQNHHASWAYFAEDITFQHPKVVSDHNGNAIMGGNYFDSTGFGPLIFPEPQWSQEFFLFKIDSSGNFLWGKSNPSAPNPISGRFNFDATENLDVDGQGNIYMAGIHAGTLDWGNGIVLSAGTGQLHENRLCLVSFDPNGNTRWAMLSGSESYNQIFSLRSSSAGDCFVSLATRDTADFHPFSYPGNSDLAFSTGKIIMPLPSKISESAFSLRQIYPAPSSGRFRFTGENNLSEISLFDLSGKKLISKIQGSAESFDASELPDGYYLVRLKTNNQLKYFSWLKLSGKKS